MAFGWNRKSEKKEEIVEESINPVKENFREPPRIATSISTNKYQDPNPKLSKVVTKNAEDLDSKFAAKRNVALEFFHNFRDSDALPALIKVYSKTQNTDLNSIIERLCARDSKPLIAVLPYLSPKELETSVQFISDIDEAYAPNIIPLALNVKTAKFALNFYSRSGDYIRATNVGYIIDACQLDDEILQKKALALIECEGSKHVKSALVRIVSEQGLPEYVRSVIVNTVIDSVNEKELSQMVKSPFISVNTAAANAAVSKGFYVCVIPLLNKKPISIEITERILNDIPKIRGSNGLYYSLLEKNEVDPRLTMVSIEKIGSLGKEKDEEKLKRFLNADNPEIRDVALRSLLEFYMITKDDLRAKNIDVIVKACEHGDVTIRNRALEILEQEESSVVKNAMVEFVSITKIPKNVRSIILDNVTLSPDEDEIGKMVGSPFDSVNLAVVKAAINEGEHTLLLPLLDKKSVSAEVTEHILKDIPKIRESNVLCHSLLDKEEADPRLIMASLEKIGSFGKEEDEDKLKKFLNAGSYEIRDVALRSLLGFYAATGEDIRAKNIDTIVKACDHSDATIRNCALDMLEHERSKVVKNAMVGFVSTTEMSENVRSVILGNVTESLSNHWIEMMVESLFDSVNLVVAQKAIADGKYIYILPLLDRKSVSAEITEYILKDIQNLDGGDKLFYSLLEKEGVDARLITASIQSLGSVNDMKDTRIIREFMENKNSEIRDVALETLLKYNPAEHEEKIIIEFLDNKSTSLQKWAIEKLTEFHREESIDLFIPFLDSSDDSVVELTIESIMSYDAFDNLDSLKKLSKCRDVRIRYWAIRCMSLHDNIYHTIIDMHNDTSHEVRREVAAGLGRIGNPDAALVLIKMTSDENAEVRWRAAEALGSMRIFDGLTNLKRLTGDVDANVRAASARAIGLIGALEGLEALFSLVSDENPETRRQTALAFGLLGDADAAIHLKDMINDSENNVVLQAIKAIGFIEQQETISVIYPKIKSEDKEIRDWAYWALSKSKSPVFIQEMFTEMGRRTPRDSIEVIDKEFLISEKSLDDPTLIAHIARYLGRLKNGAVVAAIKGLIDKKPAFKPLIDKAVPGDFWNARKDIGITFSIPKKLKLNSFDMNDIDVKNLNDFSINLLNIKVIDGSDIKIDTLGAKFHIGPNETARIKLNILAKVAGGSVPITMKLDIEYLGLRDEITVKQGIKIIEYDSKAPTASSFTFDGSGGSYTDYDNSKQIVIGSGGSSTVYRVEKGGKSYAMKLPNIDTSGKSIYEENDPEEFKNDLTTWLDLSKRAPDSVVKVEDYGIDTFPWVVMELAQTDLRTEMKKGVQGDPMEIIMSLLLSLQEIHDCGICHNDIKPENILLVDDMWKFSDFDQANAAFRENLMAQGTPAYFAPEQISKEYGVPSMVTDVWQMGIMICEILAGKLPYEGFDNCRTKLDLQALIINKGPDLSGVPEHYRDVLAKALAVSQEDRIKSPAQLQKELQRLKSRYRYG